MTLYKAGKTMSQTPSRFLRCGCAALFCALIVGAQAQTFNSTSTGADGALDYTGTAAGTTILFDPATHQPPLDVDGDNVYHFTSITIPTGVTVKLTASKLNFAPVYWLVQQFVLIDGTLDLSGDPGHTGGVGATRTISLPGPGGFPGGVGAGSESSPTAGFGPGGAPAPYGGTYAVGGPGNTATYGNVFILPLIGGSGGGGGGFAGGQFGGGGGAGGGALLIASSASIRVNGSIVAKGGIGGAQSSGYPGGAGSGGAIRLLAPRVFGSGTVSAAGGDATPGSYGGGAGRVRLESVRYDSVPTLAGAFRVVTLSPQAVFLPAHDLPSVRVSTVDGQAVSLSPTGSFLLPDVTINKSTQLTMNIAARNIPLGKQVNLRLYSENGADQTWISTPLTGTAAASVATASGTIPAGFSRCFVNASWTP